jgi:putative transposase
MYFIAIIDLYSRYIIAYDLSSNLEAAFCIDTLQSALSKNRPEIFNTDQGSQFTSNDFIDTLHNHDVKISMDHKGRCFGRVENWRAHHYNNHVSSPRSSNRTCATNASGFRSKYHAFALDTSAIVCGIG